MNMMKKITAAALALCLLLCCGIAAYAEDTGLGAPRFTDESAVAVTKVYRLVGDGSSPAETFTLRQVGDGIVRDGEAAAAPALGSITGAAFAEGAATENGAEGEIVIALPVYDKVGVYEYTLAEEAGANAGVTYYGGSIRLVVTVINDDAAGRLRIAAVHTENADGLKSDRFTNTYSAGALQITKAVTGNLGDREKYFPFTVTLTGERGVNYAETYAVIGGSCEDNPTAVRIGEAVTVYLKADDTLTIPNLPYGVAYTVEEDTPSDYTVTCTGDAGVIAAALQTAAFTNSKGGEPDTGISLDSLPYVPGLALAGVGAVALLCRRRAKRK